MSTVSPGLLVMAISCSWMLLVAGWPLMVVITSPSCSPAWSEGPPGTTAWTYSPSGTPASAAAAGGIGTVDTPKKAWVTLPVEMISSEMVLARSTGIAKPSPMLPLDSPEELGTVAPADGTPTSWPLQLTIAPPLLPGLMAASVWIADTSSAVVLSSPGTWMVRSRALTMPAVTVSDRPSGAPITTTGWPTTADADEPSWITLSWCEGWTLMTARSVSGSLPVICAGAVVPLENCTSIEPPSAASAMT